ncbi:MAG TPA: trigger factor family protein, partial [Atribacteraceae bacterium]|nr:trigger factor family protein [Atribacteraceae bacterium]
MVEVKKEEKAINIFELIITIEEERVKEAQETIYRELNLRTQVPGFRKGYAPRSILRRYIDPEHLRDSLVQKLVPSVFREVLEQEKGDIIGEPSLEILEAGEDQPLVFRSRYFVRPEVRLPNADSIEIRRYRLEI